MGSWSALDYLVDVRGYGLVEAVCKLLGERSQERPSKASTAPELKKATPQARPPPERLPFALPLRNKDNKRVIAYLQSRGMS